MKTEDGNEALDIAVLSASPEAYTTVRILDELSLAGAAPRLMDARSCRLGAGKAAELVFEGEKVERTPDVVIPRIGPLMTLMGKTILEHLEASGSRTTATAAALSLAADKLRSMMVLSRAGIRVPRSRFVLREEDLSPAIEALGGPPVVFKTLEGSAGRGVMVVDSVAAAVSLYTGLRAEGRHSLLQEYIRGNVVAGDLRLLTAGDSVVASMQREPHPGDFRGNVHLDGHARAHEATGEQSAVALAAARTMGLAVAGVDLLQGSDGPLVLEVNASPGIEGLESCTGVNVAAALANVALALASTSS